MIDISHYVSVREPERFEADWAGHYRSAIDALPAFRQRYDHVIDHPYGDDPAQRLNVYFPPHPTPTLIVAFIHGGGLLEGEPSLNDTLGRPWLDKGAVFATLGYRLTPAAYFPEQADDAARAIAALTRLVNRRHPEQEPRLLLVGHSIGAAIAAAVAYGRHAPVSDGGPTQNPAGVVLISGVYEFGDISPFVRDGTVAEAISPIALIETATTPTIVAYSPHEPNLLGGRPTAFAEQAERLCTTLVERGGDPQRIELDGDHVATVRAFGTSGELVERGFALATG